MDTSLLRSRFAGRGAADSVGLLGAGCGSDAPAEPKKSSSSSATNGSGRLREASAGITGAEDCEFAGVIGLGRCVGRGKFG